VGRIATIVAWLGLTVQTAGLILRWVESYRLGIGHAPLSNFYESLVFGAWSVVLVYLVMEIRYRNRALGVFPLAVAFLAMAYASFSPGVESKIQPLIPALKSNWLIAHVITCFLGYAAFAVACGLGMLYLIKRSTNSPNNPGSSILQRLPGVQTLDELIYQNVVFGFLLLSVGIITGSVWANSAWGNYWSWDPKETWSLITWLVYAFMLHARLVRGWHGRKIAWVSIIGFGCVLFTYFGVNFLLSGLHSYAQ
jgi:cytochrome c-type biogenesis protein CcsB